MSEWYDNQKQSISNIRQLLQERLDKTNPRRTLTADEQRRLFKLEHIAEKLTRRENVLPNIRYNLYDDIDTDSKEIFDEIIWRT